MKKLSFALALACIFGLGLSLKAQSAANAAQPAPKQITTEEDSSFVPEISVELDWRTKYVSKGKIINPDHNIAIDVRLDLAGFYAEIWSPIDMTSQNDGYKPLKYAYHGSGYMNKRKFRAEEIDYSIGYAYKFDADTLGGFSPLTIDFNYTYYQYPRYREFGENRYFSHFHEVPLTLTVKLNDVLTSIKDKDDPVSLAVGGQWYYDIENYWWYGNFFADLGYDIDENLSVGLKNTWYWADRDYCGHGTNTLTTIELKPSISYKITKEITVGAYVAGAYFASRKVRKDMRESESQHESTWWGGITFGFSF